MPSIIEVNNLSKSFIISHEGGKESYTTFRDVMAKKAKKLFSFSSSTNKATSKEEFWALKDVSFSIEQGDRVGIIGRNGAGKSTLLKILSRITEPTKGNIKIRGRIASLLEVGTGFHPELTGRENIFLNGAILGMSRAEIRKKFDEIVDFAEIEKFLDTPVKRYSSGMYVRLAFAVAAHLEPEILVVDEVLAVGDSQFQKKCMGKMESVSKNEGRTILFVSHNIAAVNHLCTKGLVLKKGNLVFSGASADAVNYYQNNHQITSFFEHLDNIDEAPGNLDVKILKFEVSPLNGDVISISSGIRFELHFFNYKEGINLDTTFELRTTDDIAVFHRGVLISLNKDSRKGTYIVSGELCPNLLNSGVYKFKLIFGENQKYPLLIAEDFLQFEVLNESEGTNSQQLSGFLAINIPFGVDFKN